MIIAASPYAPSKQLGTAYNQFMARLWPDDWGCLIDHDAMFTTTIWHAQMVEAIKTKPDAGLFVPRTNRIGCGWMKLPGVSPKNHDMLYHRKIGWDLSEKHGGDVLTDVTIWEEQPSKKPLSGVLMLISKDVWNLVGGFKPGFLTVDNDMHSRIRKAGLKVYLMESVYIYHYYRALGRGT